MIHAHKAKEGHKYLLGNKEVLAVQSGIVVHVREITNDYSCPLGPAITAKASWLKPLPMKYYNGEIINS